LTPNPQNKGRQKQPHPRPGAIFDGELRKAKEDGKLMTFYLATQILVNGSPVDNITGNVVEVDTFMVKVGRIWLNKSLIVAVEA
jgi:hypothetical protein